MKNRHSQSGVALVVVLMLLLIVTLLGLVSMRNAIMQERMAGASYTRSLAFNASESALRAAEAVAATKPTIPAAGCSNGVCVRPAAGTAPIWEASGFWDGATPVSISHGAAYKGVTSKYIIQDYGRAESKECGSPIEVPPPPCTANVQMYQVVARSVAPNGSEVILQSLYQVP